MLSGDLFVSHDLGESFLPLLHETGLYLACLPVDFDDMLGSGVIDVQLLCSILNLHLLGLYHLDDLLPFPKLNLKVSFLW